MLWNLKTIGSLTVMLTTYRQGWYIMGPVIAGLIVVHLVRRTKQPIEPLSSWCLLVLALGPLALGALAEIHSAALRGNPPGIHWQQVLAWTVILAELVLANYLVWRLPHRAWLAVLVGGVALWCTLGAKLLWSMSITNVWL